MSKAIFLTPIDGKPGKPGQVYYPLTARTLPKPTPSGRELLVKITAASLNHRDLFCRQHLYPGVTFDVPLGSDGVGVVTATGPDASAKKWIGKRVILCPLTGWKDSVEAPEDPRGTRIMGGTKAYNKGTLQEYVSIAEDEVEDAPAHLSDAEAAALPLTALTGWRALVTKAGEANSGRGSTVLITGIGGGVALIVLRIAVARGTNVYVTSSSETKIKRAVELGARAGVSYKEAGWEKKLLGMLPPEKKFFDAVIDGAGGDSIEKSVRLLKVGWIQVSVIIAHGLTIGLFFFFFFFAGGVLSVYGMTVSPKMNFTMAAVLKNIDVKGSTMGSRKEFKEVVDYVTAHKIHPVVSRTVQCALDDLAGLDSLFEDMKQGSQFGKLVIEFGKFSTDSKL